MTQHSLETMVEVLDLWIYDMMLAYSWWYWFNMY